MTNLRYIHYLVVFALAVLFGACQNYQDRIVSYEDDLLATLEDSESEARLMIGENDDHEWNAPSYQIKGLLELVPSLPQVDNYSNTSVHRGHSTLKGKIQEENFEFEMPDTVSRVKPTPPLNPYDKRSFFPVTKIDSYCYASIYPILLVVGDIRMKVNLNFADTSIWRITFDPPFRTNRSKLDWYIQYDRDYPSQYICQVLRQKSREFLSDYVSWDILLNRSYRFYFGEIPKADPVRQKLHRLSADLWRITYALMLKYKGCPQKGLRIKLNEKPLFAGIKEKISWYDSLYKERLQLDPNWFMRDSLYYKCYIRRSVITANDIIHMQNATGLPLENTPDLLDLKRKIAESLTMAITILERPVRGCMPVNYCTTIILAIDRRTGSVSLRKDEPFYVKN